MWCTLLPVLAFLVQSTLAVTLSGPDTIFACNTYGFSFADGTSPYTFHPMLGAGATGEVLGAVEQGYFSTNDTTYWLYINNAVGSVMEFYVTDATQAMSNPLWYVVQDNGNCPSSTAHVAPVPSTTSGALLGASNTATGSIATTKDVTSTFPTGVSTRTAGDGAVVTASSAQTWLTARPSSSTGPSVYSLAPSTTTVLIVAGTVAGVVLLAIGFCVWRWCRARKTRTAHRIRRSQPRELMMNADKNNSGLLLTGNSPLYGPVPSTPISANRTMPGVPQATHLIPSSKEMRMRGAVTRAPDLEDGLSVSELSGPMSTARSTSIWPESNGSSAEQVPSRGQQPYPSSSNNQRSLQAIIGRELENILQNPRTLSSPTISLTNTPSPFSSLNDLQDSETSAEYQPTQPMLSEKPNLTLAIPGTPQTIRDARSILPSANTPISRRDMEVLADLVAQRLIRDRGPDSPVLNPNPEMPPPSYS